MTPLAGALVAGALAALVALVVGPALLMSLRQGRAERAARRPVIPVQRSEANTLYPRPGRDPMKEAARAEMVDLTTPQAAKMIRLDNHRRAAFAGPAAVKTGSRGLARYTTYPTLAEDDNIIHFTRLLKGPKGAIPPGFEWTVALTFPDGDTQLGYLPADPATGGPDSAQLLLRVDVAEMEYQRRHAPAVDA